MSFLGGQAFGLGKSALLQTDPLQAMPHPLLAQAYQQFPILQRLGLQFQMSPPSGDNMLEFWPPGEPGSPDQLRPKGFDLNRPGVEVYSNKTRPMDIMADVASHYLRESDPRVKRYYDAFSGSLTDRQKSILKDQYQYAKQNEGETRPFSEWRDTVGLPAFFRGYAFQQWPQEFNQRAYTPQQIQMFDQMMQYLQGQ